MQTERKGLNTYLLENHQCLHQNVGGLSLGSVACTSKEMVTHYGRSELNKGTLGLYSLSSKTRKSWQRLAVQRAATVPQRSNLRCYWNILCSSASHHLLLLADSRYQMEISHRSSPKTAPDLSQQRTFMTCSLRHLCPLITRACKSACICKGTKPPYLEMHPFLGLFKKIFVLVLFWAFFKCLISQLS